jgi:acyl-CoA hydrolase
MTPKNNPESFTQVGACVDEIFRRVGKKIVLGMPLGLGKSVHLANEIYRRAKNDPEIELVIASALALEKPKWSSDLERRMLEPIVDRIWNGVPDFDYMVDLRRGILPSNVTIREFFCKAGGYVGNSHAQQEYISSNYTHIVRDLVTTGINVFVHIVAKQEIDGETVYSDSCNSDIGAELLDAMEKEKMKGVPFVHVGHVNGELPFMYGDAVMKPDRYDIILDNPELDFPLFSVPKAAVDVQDHMIGLHVSALVKDGGTLQIGIGTLGDAIASSLIMRHSDNGLYRSALDDAGIDARYDSLIRDIGGREPFEQGLYAATEMLVEVFIDLYEAGIIKREVYENREIQRRINQGLLSKTLTPESVDALLAEEPFSPLLTEKQFNVLKDFGIFTDDLEYRDYSLILGDTVWPADFRDAAIRRKVVEAAMGKSLRNGIVVHGGFFIGSNGFYDRLRRMPDFEKRRFSMSGVNKINQLYGDEKLRSLQRKDARFVNTGMIVTLLGNICSDGLENGTVISGVGGQYNFVSMAHALPDARLIMMVRSTRTKGRDTLSNIVFNYGHTTIPRHLRDIVVTEYGIADLLGKPDKQVIAELINISDSRFQGVLLEQAKQAGKIDPSYTIPEPFRHNTPERIDAFVRKYREKGVLAAYPFGTEITEEEGVIGRALKDFKHRMTVNKAVALKGLARHFFRKVPSGAQPYLERLKLSNPLSIREKMMQKVVVYALESSGSL